MEKRRLNFRVVFLFLTLVLTYTIPMSFIFLPDKFEFKRIYIVTLALTSMLSILYLILSIIYRGFVEYNMDTIGLVGHYYERKFCRRCDYFKPERAHHCSACGRCIKKMDHHCFWINNCVNYDNQGHFIRFLFFTTIANLLVFVYTLIKSMAVFFIDHSLQSRELYFVLVGFGVTSLVTLIVTGSFFYLQIRLALTNTTFIEQLKQEDLNKFGDAELPMPSPYDRGWMKNLEDTLGPPYTFFMLGPFGDGLRFTKTYPTNYWPDAHKHYYIDDTAAI